MAEAVQPLPNDQFLGRVCNMKKVLLVQPSLQPPGGSRAVAAWMIEALKREHAVSVLTWTPIDLAPINRYYGTSLSGSEFTVYGVHPMVRRLIDLIPGPIGLLKANLLLRQCKMMKDEYDVIITAHHEADFGRMGIQYVHFPRFYQPRPAIDQRWVHRSPALIDAYNRLCMRLSGFSFERVKQNLTLVNSDWTGNKVREWYGIVTTTLYPPVPGIFPDVPWEDRENGFVCISRISPEKGLEQMIDSLAAVRSQGWDIHLHIIGGRENSTYYDRIHRLVQENPSWIVLEQDLSREELVRLVSMHRYGIHGMSEEHFGIGVAELVRGGCIVFVPRGGGQVEVVGGDERLLYGSADEAVTKIVRTLSDPDLQRSLRDHLASRKELFSARQFILRIQSLVRHFGET